MSGVNYQVATPDVTTSVADILADTGTSLPSDIADVQTEVDKIETPSNAVKRQAGRLQIAKRNITEAANAGGTLCFTVTANDVMLEAVVLMSNGTTTADLTSAAILTGDSGVVELIDSTAAAKANIDALSEQASWTGACYLVADDNIAVDLQGTGATAVDLELVVKYRAVTDGAYLVAA